MKSLSAKSGFSLIEVTLALGVAAFCLVTILGLLPVGLKTQQEGSQQTRANAIISQIVADLRADIRLPPGQASKEQDSGLGLHGHWAALQQPDTLYFTNDTTQTGSVNQNPAPPNAVFRATVTYLFPPTQTTSIAKIIVTWPAAQSDLSKVAGTAEMFAAVNR